MRAFFEGVERKKQEDDLSRKDYVRANRLKGCDISFERCLPSPRCVVL